MIIALIVVSLIAIVEGVTIFTMAAGIDNLLRREKELRAELLQAEVLRDNAKGDC